MSDFLIIILITVISTPIVLFFGKEWPEKQGGLLFVCIDQTMFYLTQALTIIWNGLCRNNSRGYKM